MKIKRLELQGFKSFADRTVLHFGEGITGVLGPNGCGKSNIVDALRWAMGEQSAKHLRGSGMDDVIFAGSESRGPMGMAEVTITFKNDGELVPPEYAKFSEISVTRRLFRDGTSEYMINKRLSRLRDVHELFMGTGIGTKSYAIVEQGRIGLVVTAKAEDRRSLIEDAAGVTKYKSRRKQAERKLDAAEQNLLRVSDIVGELKGRLGTLERQKKKAEQYKALRGDLKSLDLVAAVHRHLELTALERFETKGIAHARGRVDNEASKVEAEEQAVILALQALETEEAALRQAESELHELEQHLAVSEKNVEHFSRELSGHRERKALAEAEKEELSRALETARDDRGRLLRDSDDLDSCGGEDSERLGTVLEELHVIEGQTAEHELALERAKQGLIDCLTAIAEQENNSKNLALRAEDLQARTEKLQSEASSAQKQSKDFERQAAQARETLSGNRQLKLSLDDEKSEKEALLETTQTDLVANEAKLIALREELMDKRSRLSSLEEIRRNYEGCHAGARSLMRRRDEDPVVGDRVHGLVADVISAAPKYEGAVEAVLGERMQYVIVQSQDDSIDSIEYLRTAADGRSTFVPLDLREDHVSWAPRPSSQPPTPISERPVPSEIQREARQAQEALLRSQDQDVVPSGAEVLPVPEPVWEEEDLWPNMRAPGVLGKMIDLVDAKPGYEQVKRVLLGDVVVVEGLEQARAIWDDNGHRKTLVTLDGEVLDPVGLLSGGTNDGVSSGMLAQQREIAELGEQVTSLESLLAQAEERHGGIKQRVSKLEKALAGLSQNRHAEELSIVKLEQDVRGLEQSATSQAERRLEVERELENLQSRLAGVAAEQQQATSALAEFRDEKARLDRAVTLELVTLNEKKMAAQGVSDRVTELKVRVAATTEKRESFERSKSDADRRIAELESRLGRVSQTIDQSIAEDGRLETQIQQTQEEIETLGEDTETKRDEVTQGTEQHRTRSQQVKEEDAAVRTKLKTLDALREELNGGLLRQREHQMALEALCQQIDERYQLVLNDVIRDYHDAPLQTNEEREQRRKLRNKIDRMGEINLASIREYDEVSERYNFLNDQQADLDKAIGDLKSAIKKIDVTSQERFVKAFDLVKAKFEIVFPRLFNGGSATLSMTDPSDPLRSGIELLAQPPGKKLQSVNLLSGGEKALTAISLIFSIFLIKPTPFCLLDEVDAPLDDANVHRYNEMVRDMSSLSQFILITHNKRTMEIPDRLYGVTMETPGISKLVGVDMKTTEYELENAS